MTPKGSYLIPGANWRTRIRSFLTVKALGATTVAGQEESNENPDSRLVEYAPCHYR